MKISFFQVSIECERAELADAIQALREIATIAPVSAPVSSAPVSAPRVAYESGDSLLALLKRKGKGTRYSPNGCHSGLTRAAAFERHARACGISEVEIADAIAAETAREGRGEVLDTVADADSASLSDEDVS